MNDYTSKFVQVLSGIFIAVTYSSFGTNSRKTIINKFLENMKTVTGRLLTKLHPSNSISAIRFNCIVSYLCYSSGSSDSTVVRALGSPPQNVTCLTIKPTPSNSNSTTMEDQLQNQLRMNSSLNIVIYLISASDFNF